MKRIGLLIIFLLITFPLIPVNCDYKSEGNDDDNAKTIAMLTLAAGYEFIDQDLQGKISAIDWEYQSGKARISHFDDTKLSIDIYSETPDGGDQCDAGAFTSSNYYIIFSIPNETGVYQLSTSQSVTFVDSSGDILNNTIAMTGAVEILSIDTSGNVTGRMDVRYSYNDEDYVNGNFIAAYCESK